MAFAVLFVCTGNVCRSPLAELLFAARVADGSDVVLASAGMAALVGHGIDGPSADALRRRGIDPDGHRARQFRPRMAQLADLVLTAETAHRDQVMTEVPDAFRRTFTMKEFARVVRGASGEAGDPRSVVARAAAARHLGGPVAGNGDDVPDPYRASAERAEAVASEIERTVLTTVDALGFATTRSRARPRPRPSAQVAAGEAGTVPNRPRPQPR